VAETSNTFLAEYLAPHKTLTCKNHFLKQKLVQNVQTKLKETHVFNMIGSYCESSHEQTWYGHFLLHEMFILSAQFKKMLVEIAIF